MRAMEFKFLRKKLVEDEIGIQKEEITESEEIPIIKHEEIYAKEFYQANEVGYKPSLRLRISALNYNQEEELIYMGKTYTIIRISEPNADEVILVCEVKLKNV